MLQYREVLTESKEYFDSLKCGNILGEGYFNVAGNAALFEQYTNALTRGADANSAAQMKLLMENSNREILTEASISGLAPIYALSQPLIRMLWPKLHLKEAVNTIVADNPRLLITYLMPYIEKADKDGRPVKYYIPYEVDAARNEHGDLADNYVSATVALEQPVVTYDFWEKDGKTRFAGVASRIKFQPLDADFLFKSVTVGGKVVPVGLKPTMVNGTLIYDYNVKVSEETFAGKVILTVDFEKATCTVACVALQGAQPTAVEVVAHYSTEYHENVVSTGLETGRDEINIATGDHISATVPVSFLQDMQAMYKVSGTEELTASMSKLVELQLDKRIAKFIADAFVNQPGHAKPYRHLPDNSQRFAVFNAKPSATFTGTQRAWRDEIRVYIDDLAARIEVATYLEDGIYTVVCNPKDAQLINNINWTFSGGASVVDGVSVSYSVGTFVGTHTYKIISSPQVPQGYIYIMFIPAGDKQLTYAYYPYSFVMESNYRDPNRANVPSLMTTKRDAVKDFLPAIACIQVMNNGSALSGDNVFDIYREYVPTKQVTGTEDLDFVETGAVPGSK